MKCPSCGAEIKPKSKFCESCGSQISYKMQREQENLNKQGCPKCHSSNVQFRRETHGEVRSKRSRQFIHMTVGFCKDCGYTWYPNIEAEMPKKKHTLWWILGWIFFFPIPVMILIWRKKNTWSPVAKIIVTIVFWLLLFIIGSSGDKNTSSKPESSANSFSVATEQSITTNENLISNNTEEPVLLITPTENTEKQFITSDTQNLPQEGSESVDKNTNEEITLEPISESKDSNNPYSDLDAFIDSYNAAGSVQIVSKEQIDIHDKSGGYYRTEFRLNPFKDAIAYHIVFEDGSSADLIDKANWPSGETVNGSIDRIYVLAATKESFKLIFRTVCKSMHPDTITDADIDKALDEMMHPYRYEEMEFLFSSGSGVIGSRNEGYTYSIKEKSDYFDFFLD